MQMRHGVVVLFALILLSSCDMTRPGSALPPPRRDCSDARARLRIPPKAPRMRAFNETTTSFAGGGRAPKLELLPLMELGVVDMPSPLDVNPGMTKVNDLDPAGLKPLVQMVYGGRHGEPGSDAAYRIGTGDSIDIHVQDHPEFTGTVTVKPDGAVLLPTSKDRVRVADMTLERAAGAVTSVLRRYLRSEPKVRIGLDYAANRYYHVLGEVRNPGRYPMGTENIRVSEAVFRANSHAVPQGGDFTHRGRIRAEVESHAREGYVSPRYADLRNVYLITPHRSRPSRRIVDVNGALIQGRTGGDPVVKPGQVIFVPSSVDGRMTRFLERLVRPLERGREADEVLTWYYERLASEQVDRPAVRYTPTGWRQGGGVDVVHPVPDTWPAEDARR